MRARHTTVLALLAALLTWGCSGGTGTRPLTVLHVNDLHARLLPDAEGRGGFAYLAAAIDSERSRSQAALVVHAGDLVQGTPVSSIYQGLPCFELANLLGLDANTLGNHEFDYGWEKIRDYLAVAEFTTVCANVADERGQLLVPEPYTLFDVHGLRVAVIGAMTEHLPELSKRSKLGPWRVLPVVDTVRRYARELRPQTHLIVVLGHLADEEEDKLLREVPEIDVIIGGHSHAGLERPKVYAGRIAVRVRAYGVELGRLDLEIDPDARRVARYRWRVIPVTTSQYQPKPPVARAVERWESKVASLVDVPIATASRPIDRDEVRTMLEQAMVEATGADLAYMNRGGVRDGLPRGTILVRHAWNVMPFENSIVAGVVRGDQLPGEVRERHPVEPGRSYRFATNDFTAELWARQGHALPLADQGILVREAFIRWLRQKRVLP